MCVRRVRGRLPSGGRAAPARQARQDAEADTAGDHRRGADDQERGLPGTGLGELLATGLRLRGVRPGVGEGRGALLLGGVVVAAALGAVATGAGAAGAGAAAGAAAVVTAAAGAAAGAVATGVALATAVAVAAGGVAAAGGLVATGRGVVATGRGVVAAGGLVATRGGVVPAGGLVATGRGVIATGGLVATRGGVIPAGGLVTAGRGVVPAGGLVATGRGVVATGGLVATRGGVVAAVGLPTIGADADRAAAIGVATAVGAVDTRTEADRARLDIEVQGGGRAGGGQRRTGRDHGARGYPRDPDPRLLRHMVATPSSCSSMRPRSGAGRDRRRQLAKPESKSSDSAPPVHMHPRYTHAALTLPIFQSNVKGVLFALPEPEGIQGDLKRVTVM
ncbi:conserved membrane hypothetical protein [Streptomyces murinus]